MGDLTAISDILPDILFELIKQYNTSGKNDIWAQGKCIFTNNQTLFDVLTKNLQHLGIPIYLVEGRQQKAI